MREFFGSVNQAFRAGLEPEADANNADFLVRCHNARPDAVGLRPVERPTLPTDTIAVEPADWPFPQYRWRTFLGTGHLLLYRTKITDGLMPILDNIPAGGVWQTAEQPQCFLASNGAALVTYVPGQEDVLALVPNCYAAGVCAAGDGFVLGGLGGSRVYGAEFQALFDAWKAHTGDVTHEGETAAGCVMWWSQGGGGSDYPFAAEMAALGVGDFGKYRSVLEDLIAAGRVGFWRPPTFPVRAVKALGSNAVVYGANWIGLLDSVYGDDGITRFRWRPLLDVGIGGRGHVCGDLRTHYFLDTSGVLWALSADGPVRLGYRAYLAPLAAGESATPVAMAYDPQEGEAYVAAGQACYVYRAGAGLFGRDGSPTALVRRNGMLYGHVHGAASNAFEVVSSRFDYKQRGLKSTQNVEVAAFGASGLHAGLDYRYDGDAEWREGPWLPLNPDGAAYPMITAADFRLRVNGEWGNDGRIDYAYHRWKLGGRRSIRGLYGQSG